MLEMYLLKSVLRSWQTQLIIVLIKEGLEDYNLVALIQEAHEGAQHPFICSSGNCDLCFWINGLPKEW